MNADKNSNSPELFHYFGGNIIHEGLLLIEGQERKEDVLRNTKSHYHARTLGHKLGEPSKVPENEKQ